MQNVTCGTNAGYARHMRKKEKPCEYCRIAHTSFTKLAQDRRSEDFDCPGDKCGKYTTYINYKCRGDACREAFNTYRRDLRARKNAAAKDIVEVPVLLTPTHHVGLGASYRDAYGDTWQAPDETDGYNPNDER